ncbi:MAG: hypothetical protein ABIH20_02185 [Candidatus Diapherotrites archaeon]
MVKENIIVELIPWMHYFPTLAHEDVVKHVKRLPKNSTIAIELPQAHAELVNLAISSFRGEKRGLDRLSVGLDELRKVLPDDFWAVMEVLTQCKKRNIKVIPIESKALFDKVHSIDIERPRNHPELKATIDVDVKREKFFVNEIIKLLNSSRKSGVVHTRLYVLSGAAHCSPMRRMLLERGYNAELNTSIFTKQSQIERGIRTDNLIRQACDTGEYRGDLIDLVHRLLTDIRKDNEAKKDILVKEIESALFPKSKHKRRIVIRKSTNRKSLARKTRKIKSAQPRRR